MTLKEPIQSRCWRSYVADASVYRNLPPPVECASCRRQQVPAAGKVRVAGEEGGRVADCVRRYQSAMLKMRGTRGLAWLRGLR